MALEGIINKVSAQNWIDATKKKTDGIDTETNRENLMRLSVPFRVELAQTPVRIRDFLSMQLGDVLMTDQRISQEVAGFVKSRKKFRGQPGLVGKKRGFMITEVLSEIGKE